MANVESDIWQALKVRLDEWTETDIAMPDEKYAPSAKKPYIWVQPVGLEYDFNAGSLACGNEYRGFLNLSVMIPLLGWNYGHHVGMAGRMGQHWSGWSHGGVSVFRHPRVIGSPYTDGSHNRLDVTVQWRCFA